MHQKTPVYLTYEINTKLVGFTLPQLERTQKTGLDQISVRSHNKDLICLQ